MSRGTIGKLCLLTLFAAWPVLASALLPPPEWECCQRQGEAGAQCREKMNLDAGKCAAVIKSFNEVAAMLNRVNNPAANAPSQAAYLVDTSGQPVASGFEGGRIERAMQPEAR
jgi:hypothetical protein